MFWLDATIFDKFCMMIVVSELFDQVIFVIILSFVHIDPLPLKYVRLYSRLLEEGNLTDAENVKSQLEQKQRDRRKQVESMDIQYEPKWFRWWKLLQISVTRAVECKWIQFVCFCFPRVGWKPIVMVMNYGNTMVNIGIWGRIPVSLIWASNNFGE